MLFSFDTAWQKSGGASAPPGPPGFDATDVVTRDRLQWQEVGHFIFTHRFELPASSIE